MGLKGFVVLVQDVRFHFTHAPEAHVRIVKCIGLIKRFVLNRKLNVKLNVTMFHLSARKQARGPIQRLSWPPFCSILSDQMTRNAPCSFVKKEKLPVSSLWMAHKRVGTREATGLLLSRLQGCHNTRAWPLSQWITGLGQCTILSMVPNRQEWSAAPGRDLQGRAESNAQQPSNRALSN